MSKEKKRKKILKKSSKLVFHIGFWTTVTGILLTNFLYNGIFQEKTKKDNIDE